MFALETRAPVRILVPRVAHHELLEHRLRQYRPEVQGPVKALARRHRSLADLAASFPALLFALAHPRHGVDPESAIRAVIAGEALETAAKRAGVPMWLRRVEPRMFAAPLPLLPDGPFLRRTIVNHLPRRPKDATLWFETVAAAARDGTDAFAVWCAGHLARRGQPKLVQRLRLLSLWAWYSAHGGTNGHALIEHAFHPEMTVTRALWAAQRWQIELELHLDLGHAPVGDMWFAPANVEGYDFVPLRSETDIRAEAKAMRNCLRTYSFRVANGNVRLWSVRKDGERAATLSVKRTQDFFVCVSEVKGPENKPVPEELLRAVQRWFFAHAEWNADPKTTVGRAALSRESWRALFRPYWVEKQCIPHWLPLRPARSVIAAL